MAQIGLMHKELVETERWIDEAGFRRILGVYQALPGPEAHELAVYFGYRRHGRWGGFLAGLGFMLPGFVLTLLLAALYVRFGASLWGVRGVLFAVKPVVIALIANALVRLSKASLVNEGLVLVAMGAGLAAWLLPLNAVLLMLLFGIVYYAARARRSASAAALGGPFLLGGLGLPFPLLFFLFFLGIGLFTFGGAYTAIPLLEQGAVRDFGWITQDQFLDAVALSSLVPAPLLMVGAFVGVLVAGWWGGVVATVGLFLPAFGFTLVAHDRLVRLVANPRAHDFFDGVTAAVVGLIAVTLVHLASAAFPDLVAVAIGVLAFAALRLLRANPAVVVLLGAAVGLALQGAGHVG